MKAFTLIELLVVIFIIAILSGTAMPYAQHYIEESKISKAKQDMLEIRNALLRYETDQYRPYPDRTIISLIGPYLNQGIIDPWGNEYKIDPDRTICYSLGPSRKEDAGTQIIQNYHPPLAISRAYLEDVSKNGIVTDGDKLILKFTRPLYFDPSDMTGDVVNNGVVKVEDFDFFNSDFTPSIDIPASFTEVIRTNYQTTLEISLQFTPGKELKPSIQYITAAQNTTIVDYFDPPNLCRADQPILIRSRY